MRAIVRKWGNSAAIRIPSPVLEAANLSLDVEVDITEENGRIVIEPVRAAFDLGTLLSAITPDNVHMEVDSGEPIGKELL